ncbi:hypothetical protein BC834DRAFT_950309 [Gloeopeniophorella convolvens]|nr:hypothetical protein BC834DRAFT_950309 [Gloeopeniophorella convolvens]
MPMVIVQRVGLLLRHERLALFGTYAPRLYQSPHTTVQIRVTNLLKFIRSADSQDGVSAAGGQGLRLTSLSRAALDAMRWGSVTELPTVDAAISRLELLTGAVRSPSPSATPTRSPPTWLLIEICSKVHSPQDAHKASHLLVTNLPHIPPDLRPHAIILAAHILGAYKVLPALERVVKLFIGLPIFHEYWHFNRMLRALVAYVESSDDGQHIGPLAILLLRAMTERKLVLTKKTYRYLLQNRYVTLQLTEDLRQRMVLEKIVPTRAHLESFLRIFANSPTGDATIYARNLSKLDTSRRAMPPHMAGPEYSPQPHLTRTPASDYLRHLVDENDLRSQFNADAEWFRFQRGAQSPRFLNKRTTTPASWVARLFSLSRTRSLSPENLVAFFEWSQAQTFPFRTNTALAYTIVLNGLLRKRAYTLALKVWERYRSVHGTRKLRLDHTVLAIGVEVLIRAGHPARALELINNPITGYRRSTTRPMRNYVVPLAVVNRFMQTLVVANPSAALQLWEHIPALYNAAPNTRTFTFMLDAARRATLRGESFTGAMSELGLGFAFRPAVPVPRETPLASLRSARRQRYTQLRAALGTDTGDMWGAERAWRRAYRTFADALLSGWPALADVRAPAHAVRASGDGPATAPLSDLRRFLAPAGPASDDKEPPPVPADASPPFLPAGTTPAYPAFAPDDAVFRAAILLLGAARSAGTIPLVLAWMRALGVAPRPRTLAYALVFWAEVSVGAPLLERLRGGGGEYLRLVRWMEDWVGLANVPNEAEIGVAMRRVDVMRNGSGRGQADND